MPWTYMLGKIKVEISLVLIYTTLIAVWHQELEFNHINIPLAVPAILGTVISLLLAFRSNQAYDRWWEARIVWGAIVNDSRSLIRQIQCFIKDPDFSVEINRFIEQFGNRHIVWTYSLGRSLRNQAPLNKELELMLSEKERNNATKFVNVPNALLSMHASDLRHALQSDWINAYQQVELDQTLSKLCDSMGKCERIKSTVFPTTYSLYIHFAVYLFIIMLPFGMTASLGYIQVPLVVAISSTFLLIEKMAMYLQDPFENRPTDTPVTAIAQTIERDIRQMMNEKDFTSSSKAEITEEMDLPPAYYVL